MLSFISVGLGLIPFAHALVLPRQGAVTSVSTAQINSFTPFTHFASTAYCQPSTTINWSCGANCNANPGFIPVASGGDGSETQFWFVGFDPALNMVIVSHQGTDPSQFEADLTDADFFLEGLDQTMFPGTSGLEVHNGFQDTQARSAPAILAAVQTALSTHGATSVTLVGHSLGAAISLIDAVYLPLHLPSNIRFKFVGYGLPRVGNPAFAEYLDAHFPDLTHINNKEDVVPILPGRFLGFQHPHGEIHIQDSGAWDACAGDDNTSDLCTTGDVGNIFEGDTSDHDGPYNGIEMGC
ncbi:lipase class 3 family protein [Hysterangium stoloniferum]|nr:lipase class 3 family protein [Hysterangium stoloniferum]